MNRREFIRNAALSLAAAGTASGQVVASPELSGPGAGTADPAPSGADLIDTQVYLSRWPYRRVWGDETGQLAGRLKHYGVASAWAGSFDALLHRDIGAVNIRLADECAQEKKIRLLPFGAVNPTLPDWEEDLRRCHETHRMPGIRLHPDFHGYALDDPRLRRLLDLATQRGLIVQISLGMEDPRLQPHLAILPPTDPEPLIEWLPNLPRARVMLLNFWRAGGANRVLLVRLHHLTQISFDTATIETMAGIEALLRAIPPLRLAYSSYAPYYNFGSSWRKLHESVLTDGQLAAIRQGHARKILSPA